MPDSRRCAACDRVTRIVDAVVDRDVICPRCGSAIPVTAREINPYAPPRTPLETEVERSEVPPVVPTSTLAKFGEAFRLLMSNLGVIGPLVLSVWFPGNLAISYVAFHPPEAWRPVHAKILSSLHDFVLGPIYAAGMIHTLSRRKQGEWVTYPEALAVGLRNWWPMFRTRFITALIVLVGLIAFLVPGILLRIRYALIDPIVVLEGTRGTEARQRSERLSRGQRWQLLAAALLFFLIKFSTLSGIIWIQNVYRYSDNMIVFMVINYFLCLLDSIISIVIFLFYWESIYCKSGDLQGAPGDSESRSPLFDRSLALRFAREVLDSEPHDGK